MTGLLRQSTVKDVGNRSKLTCGHFGQCHVVESLAHWVRALLEEKTPVQAGLLALLVELRLDVGQRDADGAVSLLPNDSYVPLLE